MVKEKDCIDCKLYWNGQMSVFKPSDVKTILPRIFNMKWNENVPLKKIEKSEKDKKGNEEDDTKRTEPSKESGDKSEQKEEDKDEYEKSINEKFLEGILGYYQKKDQYRTIDELIELMDEVIQDKYFNNFYKNLVS